MTAPNTPLTYRPELTGLRAVAVWVVVVQHWALLPIPLGEVGRMTFFVLSGYLVSGIVWKQQIYPGTAGSWRRRLGVFYARRALRILPPYYLALIISLLIPLEALREYPLWFFLPICNQLFYDLGRWGEGCGHFWTLAIDEQFYLLWPLILLFTGRRAGWLLALTVAGVVFRVAWGLWVTPVFVLVLSPASLDMFGLGALLRLLEQGPLAHRLNRGWLVAAAWGSWWVLWDLTHRLHGELLWILSYTTVGAVAAALTLNWLLLTPTAGPRLGLLQPLLQWVGQRSFGFYLYHLMLPVVYQRAVYRLIPDTVPDFAHLRQWWLAPVPTVLVLTPVLVLMSAASWRFVEAPLERYKSRLRYRPRPAPLVA